MALQQCISWLGGWEGYAVSADRTEYRRGQSWCVIVLAPVSGQPRCCSGCGQYSTAIHDLEERRIRDLPQAIRPLIEKRELEMGHARALTTARQQFEVGSLVAKKGFSVRETEALVRRMVARAEAGAKPNRARSKDPDISRLENDLADKLGATVELQHSPSGKGKLVISYHSLDELDGILSHIK